MRFGRQRYVGICVAAAWGLVGLIQPSVLAQTPERGAVHVVSSVITDALLVTVRLDLLLGHGDETRRTAGLSASASTWLLRGPSAETEFGGLERRAHRAGLAVDTEVGWDRTSLTLTGPAVLASLAGELAADRLSPGNAPDELVERMQDGLWAGHEGDLQGVVGPMGDVSQTAAAALEAGRTAFASRHAASRLSLDAFRRYARGALKSAPARVVIVGPQDAVRKARAAFDAVRKTTTAPSDVATYTLSEPTRMTHSATLDVEQAADAQYHLAVAWKLRGLAAQQGLSPVARDAALLVLRAWLVHPGTGLVKQVVDERGAVHELDTRLVEHAAPVLVLEGRIAEGNPADARRVLLDALAVAAESTSEEMAGAHLLALTDLTARYHDVPGRTEILSSLMASGRARDAASAAAWVHAVSDELTARDQRPIAAFARAALAPLRRLVVTAAPAPAPNSPKAELLNPGPGTMETYLRLLVDLQCPGPKFPPKVATLLREKYGITPRQYAEMTRSISRDRRLLRRLAEDAERRCQELGRLRDIMTAERVVTLHEAIACGPGIAPTTSRGRRKLTKVFRRFGVDPSWYRPLCRMARERPDLGEAMDVIDRRCLQAEASE